MKVLKYILFFIFLLTETAGIAQSNYPWKVITKEKAKSFIVSMRAWIDKHPDYSVNLNYYSYKNYTDQTPFDKSIGYLKRSGENVNSFAIGIKNIQNETYRLAVDTARKIILVAYPRKGNKSVGDIDTAQLMNKVEKFSSFSTAEESGLRVEFKTKVNIGSIEIFTGKNGEIKKMIWYYASRVTNADETDKASNDVSLPKVEVIYSNYNLNISFDYKKEFDEKQFFTLKDKIFVPTQKYKDYQIKDTRIAKH
jgi:hypothetical protein